MPISKKPRSKARTSTKASAPAALPDRRAMESFLGAIAGHRGDDATAKAQDVMDEAWERTTSRSRTALARKALGISPLGADAYVLLAEEARSIEEARDYYAKGVEAGVLANPCAGRARDADLGPGRRSFPADRYIIVYRVAGQDVLILRVAHSRRDIDALFRH
jgi:plasmid stabilization system protein ParE